MGSIYVQTNESDGNHVLRFGRSDDGRLSPEERAATGGRGDGVPHLTSQGSVALSGDGKRLLVTNAGSGDLSVFTLGAELSSPQVVPTGGWAPKSVTEHDGLVYVLNSGSPSLMGFRLTDEGATPIEGSLRELLPDADPAQVGFAPDGRSLVVTERGTNAIAVYPVGDDGLLGEPTMSPSAGPTPYGFTFSSADTLVVTEAFGAEKGKAAASSYRVAESGVQLVSRSVGNGRSEICWAVATPDGREVYTTNFADGAVSCYAVDESGALTLVDAAAGIAVDGRPGLRDEDLTRDGRFLYAIDADAGRIFGWAVDQHRLSPLGSWNGLPATVAGLAAD